MKPVAQLKVERRTSSNAAPLGITRPRVRTRANVDASWTIARKAK
jgi:hypothetical protein